MPTRTPGPLERELRERCPSDPVEAARWILRSDLMGGCSWDLYWFAKGTPGAHEAIVAGYFRFDLGLVAGVLSEAFEAAEALNR